LPEGLSCSGQWARGVRTRFEPRGPRDVVFSEGSPPRRARTAEGGRSSIPRAPLQLKTTPEVQRPWGLLHVRLAGAKVRTDHPVPSR